MRPKIPRCLFIREGTSPGEHIPPCPIPAVAPEVSTAVPIPDQFLCHSFCARLCRPVLLQGLLVLRSPARPHPSGSSPSVFCIGVSCPATPCCKFVGGIVRGSPHVFLPGTLTMLPQRPFLPFSPTPSYVLCWFCTSSPSQHLSAGLRAGTHSVCCWVS